MRNISLYLRIIFMIGITGFVLYWSGSNFAYNFACIVCLVFLLINAAILPITRKEKAIHATIYTIIMALQIPLNILLIKVSKYNYNVFVLCKIVSVLLILFPFFIKRILYLVGLDYFVYSFFDKWYGFIYAQLIYDKEAIADKLARVKRAGQIITREQLNAIIKDLPRHSSFSYINNGSLSDTYFEKAYSTLDDGYIYVVVSKSKSDASELIRAFTNKKYNHVSLSFDEELHTIISYNGGANTFSPGLNPEMISDLVSKEGAASAIYRLKATSEQKRIIIDKVKEINEVGSAYNIIGLITGYTHRSNIMFCSQFVYIMLELAKLNYFEKDFRKVRPTDFVELDYYRQLEFMFEITAEEAEFAFEKYNKKEKVIKEQKESI
ncbi:hypothetical protein [Miniphocaeibacter massiliensis]|uniref:hypothetical protein n=1 Tax=Miniphocaeibacter massiliensis TaxID=2041841 RepID=UPI000C1C77BA|nr:hypothetical protein [Miniphocaeibacter massiliensis]